MKLNNLVKEIRTGLVLGRVTKSNSEIRKLHKVITLKSLNEDGEVDIKKLETIFTEENVSPKYLTKLNDVVLRLSSPFHATSIDDSLSGMILPSNFCLLRGIKNIVIPEFLSFYLNSAAAKKQLLSQVSQSTMNIIRTTTIKELELELPTLEIQNKIVNIINLYRKEKRLLGNLIIEKEKIRNQTIKTLLNNKENK